MKDFLNKLGSRKVYTLGTVAMIVGLVLLVLSIWGFVKGGHANMTRKNGSFVTLAIVSTRWITMPVGAAMLVGGFWMTKTAGSLDQESETPSGKTEPRKQKKAQDEETEEDPLDFLK